MQFDWLRSQLGEHAQSCIIERDGERYRFSVSQTLRPEEWQAMCNGVRISKDFFASAMDAKNECERWFQNGG